MMEVTHMTVTRSHLTTKDFMVYYFAVTPGHVIGRPEPEVLCSFGTMFNQLLVSGWTIAQIFDVCEERMQYMRERDIPHDAFVIVSYPRGNALKFEDATVFMRIQPSKSRTQEQRENINRLVRDGLTFVIPTVYKPITSTGDSHE